MRGRRARGGRRDARPAAALTATLDPARRLSEGTLAQASVRARLLGLPLLRLDATVALMPAALTASPRAVGGGRGLADAVRSINDGAEILAELRRSDGSRRNGDRSVRS